MARFLSLAIYNIMLWCFVFVFGIPLLVLAYFKPKYQAGLKQKLGFFSTELKAHLQQKNKKRIVLHAVSVGELMAARPLIDWIVEWKPEWELVLSNVTKTGHELASKLYPQLTNIYLCFDFLFSIKRWFKHVQPDLILVMETEIWPNWVHQAYKKQIPMAIISGRLSNRSFSRYYKIAGFINPILKLYKAIWTQAERDQNHYLQLGAPIETTEMIGNIKFCPPVVTALNESESLKHFLEQWATSNPVLVFASTHYPEESNFMGLYGQLKHQFPELKCVVAPRHPERFESVWSLIYQDLELNAQKRSGLPPENATTLTPDILLLDSIGELNMVYRYSKLVVMGGSFTHKVGGHNVLEPLYAGIPVIFGPHMHNFEAVRSEVLELNAGLEAKDTYDTLEHIKELLSDPELYQGYQQRALGVFTKHQDILKGYIQHISQLID